MNSTIISLSDAVYNCEYMIYSVDHMSSAVSGLRGYGIFPGSKIKKLFTSSAGTLSAYEIMGTVIALRKETSENISVVPVDKYRYDRHS